MTNAIGASYSADHMTLGDFPQDIILKKPHPYIQAAVLDLDFFDLALATGLGFTWLLTVSATFLNDFRTESKSWGAGSSEPICVIPHYLYVYLHINM